MEHGRTRGSLFSVYCERLYKKREEKEGEEVVFTEAEEELEKGNARMCEMAACEGRCRQGIH